MTSPLSLFATSSLAIDFYSQFHNNKDLLELLDHLKDDDFKSKMNEFFIKMLHKTFDKYMQEVLNNKSISDIFKKDKLSKEEQVKLFIGYAVKEIYSKFRDEMISSNMLINTNVEALVSASIDGFSQIVDCNEVSNGTQVYLQLIDHLSKEITEHLYVSFCDYLKRDTSGDLYADFIHKTQKMIRDTNEVFGYTSPIRYNKRRHDNDDSNDNKKPRN
jgi:hypothetical protein